MAHTSKIVLNKMFLLPETAYNKWKAIQDENKQLTAINNEMSKILKNKRVKSKIQKWYEYRQQLARLMAYKRYLEAKKKQQQNSNNVPLPLHEQSHDDETYKNLAQYIDLTDSRDENKMEDDNTNESFESMDISGSMFSENANHRTSDISGITRLPDDSRVDQNTSFVNTDQNTSINEQSSPVKNTSMRLSPINNKTPEKNINEKDTWHTVVSDMDVSMPDVSAELKKSNQNLEQIFTQANELNERRKSLRKRYRESPSGKTPVQKSKKDRNHPYNSKLESHFNQRKNVLPTVYEGGGSKIKWLRLP